MACFPALAEALGAVKKALAEPQGVIHISAATFNWGLRGQVKNEKVRNKIELSMDKLCQENDIVC